MVDRYEFDSAGMILAQDGSYVSYSDYAELEFKVEDTRQRWEEAQSTALYHEAGRRKAEADLAEARLQIEALLEGIRHGSPTDQRPSK